MDISETVDVLKKAKEQSLKALVELTDIKDEVERQNRIGEYYSVLGNCLKEIEACDVAIEGLIELQQYRVVEQRLQEMFGEEFSLVKCVEDLDAWYEHKSAIWEIIYWLTINTC